LQASLLDQSSCKSVSPINTGWEPSLECIFFFNQPIDEVAKLLEMLTKLALLYGIDDFIDTFLLLAQDLVLVLLLELLYPSLEVPVRRIVLSLCLRLFNFFLNCFHPVLFVGDLKSTPHECLIVEFLLQGELLWPRVALLIRLPVLLLVHRKGSPQNLLVAGGIPRRL